MKCIFFKPTTNRDGGRKGKPISCKLYNPLKRHREPSAFVIEKMCEYLKTEEKPCDATYLLSDTKRNKFIDTKLGCVALGTTAWYQLSDFV